MQSLSVTIHLSSGEKLKGQVCIDVGKSRYIADHAIEYFIEETWIDGSKIEDIDINRCYDVDEIPPKVIYRNTNLKHDQAKYGNDYHPFNRFPIKVK